MIITKEMYSPQEYERGEHFYTNIIVSSSLRTDLSSLLKSLKREQLSEYEDILAAGYTRLMEKAKKELTEKGYDGCFLMSFHISSLYPGATLMAIEGEAVKRR